MMKKSLKTFLIIAIMLLSVFIMYKNSNLSKNNDDKLFNNKDIDTILNSKYYSYLSPNAKQYIRTTYEETGVLLLTEKNKRDDLPYLNPEYIEYLDNESDYAVIPSATITDYIASANPSIGSLPAKYDLRNVDGKNYITPYKNQKAEGLCWDYATNAHIESLLLVKNQHEYDETAIILSEKQIDYATAKNASEMGNVLYNINRELTSGGYFEYAVNVMLDGLGIVSNTWDNMHSAIIQDNSYLDNDEIFNFENSLYEVNSTLNFPYLNFSTASSSVKEQYLNDIKNNIMNYGGAYVQTDICYDTRNYYNGVDTMVVDAMDGGGCIAPKPHALQIIGWDDDFEYTVCKKSHGYVHPDECGKYGSVTGKGVWILKNSWGNYNSTVLLAYDSKNTVINFVTGIGERTWDNFYNLNYTTLKSATYEYSFKDSAYVTNEKLNKIKFKLNQNTNYNFYISVDGNNNNYQHLGDIAAAYGGYYYLDLSSASYIINSNTKFKVTNDRAQTGNIDFRVYTDNIENASSVKTLNINYDDSNEVLNSSNYFTFNIQSSTKNIQNGLSLHLKIKNSSGSYMSEDSFSYSLGKVYANANSGRLTINVNSFTKGTYIVETYYDNASYNTSYINIADDFIVTVGDGSEDNPWHIYNARQFNAIRNNPYDSFIIMDDIDFEYDTHDPNGRLYTDGNGFISINNFYGYIDGNGHKLKNIYSKAVLGSGNVVVKSGGIFDSVRINSKCKFSKCGISNLIVENPTIIGSYDTGGLINALDISVADKAVFNNVSVIGGTITNLNFPSYNIGGIFGEVYISCDDGGNLVFNNLYNSATIQGVNNSNIIVERLGGIAGSIYLQVEDIDMDPLNLIFNNIMNVGKISAIKNTTKLSNAFMIITNEDSNFTVNNAIMLNNPNNSVISIEGEDTDTTATGNINNLYTDSSNIMSNDNISVTTNNVNNNLSAVEIANADYSNWANFSSNWVQYNSDGIKRIPVLKNVNYDYLSLKNNVSLLVDDEVDILSIIEPVNGHNLVITTSCSFNVNVCNYTTDSNIIDFDDTTIRANSSGNTVLIIYNNYDGYIGFINVVVMPTSYITLKSNYDDNAVNIIKMQSNQNYTLSASAFERIGYTFKEWNTKSDGSGTSYSGNQSFVVNQDLTLYAMWQGINYYISFDANSGNGSMNTINAIYGQNYTLPENTFEKLDYIFKEWNTKSDGSGTKYNNQAEIVNLTSTASEEITLYAIWKYILPYKITSYNFDKQNKYISKILENTTVSNFIKNIELDEDYTLLVDYKTVNEQNLLYTGGKTKIYGNNGDYIELTNIVNGDINGDSSINSSDLLQIRKHLIGNIQLSDVYYIAGDINENGQIDSGDLLKVKKYLLGQNILN